MEESANLPESLHDASRAPQGFVTTRLFLQEFSALSELINDNNHMFFAPKERLTGSKLLGCYNKYQAWYARLPAALQIEGKAAPEPHIIALQYI